MLAEHDPFIRAGLRRTLERGGLAVVAEASAADEAVATAVALRPDLALIDVGLPGGGLEAARRIARAAPATGLAVLSGELDGDELVDAVLAGAVAYLSREMRLERLPDILHGVLAGETALPRAQSRHLIDAVRGRRSHRANLAQRGTTLSDREWEVLELLADGASTAELARRLGISEVTVRRHVSSIVSKLGVPDRAGAVALLHSRSTG
jgi:two-component system nitrate/nitrite response regulator NarL